MCPSDSLDVRIADNQYRGFPAFDEWSSRVQVDSMRWDRYTKVLERRGALQPELLKRAREVAKRAAAIDTGAIEGLYEVDRGFTFSVALQVANWEAQVASKGGGARALIESQMEAYDFVLDFATQRLPVAEAWIRTLHEVICGSQDTYMAYTEVGPQSQPLPRGKY